MKHLAVEVVDHVEGSEPLADIERVAHEVGRPDLVWQLRHQQRLLDPPGQSFLGPPFLIQPQVAVNTVDPLVVPAVSRAP